MIVRVRAKKVHAWSAKNFGRSVHSSQRQLSISHFDFTLYQRYISSCDSEITTRYYDTYVYMPCHICIYIYIYIYIEYCMLHVF